MLKMFYGISFKNLFGLFLVVLPDNSYLTNGSATSTFEITTGYRCSESFASAPLESSIKCARACIRDGNCTAASYDTAGKICELHSGNMYSERNGTNSTIVAAQGWELLTPANLTNIPANTSVPTPSVCDSGPCLNNGTCTPDPGDPNKFICYCTSQWQGVSCMDTQYWRCYSTSILVETTCLAEPLRYFNHGNLALTPGCGCACCEIDYNYGSSSTTDQSTSVQTPSVCDSSPCLNNGTCTPDPGDSNKFICYCTSQWQGVTCMDTQYWRCYSTSILVETTCLAEPLRYFNHGNLALTPGCGCRCCEIDYSYGSSSTTDRTTFMTQIP